MRDLTTLIVDTYGFVITSLKPVTNLEFAELVKQTYDLTNPRNALVYAWLLKTDAVFQRDRLNGIKVYKLVN